tara:strand:+ start:1466 stop:1816 length:351 start_codon:yes stop_codon:yes gene_type:complete
MFLIALTSSAELIYQFEDQQQEDRFYRLINETRCPKCTSGSIASSNAPVSRDLKQKIYELILAGTSDEEITNYISERFGASSSYKPAVKGMNYFLWFGPFIFLSLIVLIFYFNKRV